MSELNKHRNHGLFSDYYLNELLPQRLPEWQDNALIQKAFTEIKSLYESLKSSLPRQSEPQLEEKFIKKILAILGHVYEVQPTLMSTAAGMKKPDYALFRDRRTQESVQHLKSKLEFFKQVLAIAEAKKWERPLDKEIKNIEDKDNPSLQMDRYLYYTEVPWGILTNGRYWRLYYRKTSKELDNYFEIDLQQVLETNDLEAFKYFYFFFRREAFPESVEQVYHGSVDYAKDLGDNLKENVYEALKILAGGFLKTPRNNLDPEKDLKEIHDNCLILLYRIIFLLYAESPRRGERLLPLDDSVYREQYSIYALKNKVRDILTRKAELSPIKATLWSELKALFALVNQGSESMGIPKDRFFVPAYNGGLFDEREHEFLEKYVIADLYLAQAIDLLARTPVKGNHEKAFADYGSLQIRHLGSIYEGLLEYKLGIAKEKMVAISEKGKQKWVTAEEVQGKKAIEEVQAGDVYLYTDKGERKASGSYYTPDYIVDYIAQNTLGPILEDLKKKVNGNSNKLIDEILNLKVLDPAMGSGHFLVAATDYLARALVEALGESEKELEEDDIRWARREIVERCILGVDLNPLAVELAKLSLWLATVSKNKPLSFLDHHLRCGNSLIGATVKHLAELPELKKKGGKKSKKKPSPQLTMFQFLFKQVIQELLKNFEQIESLPSETVEQIRRKEELYNDFRRKIERFKIVADIWTSTYFGNEVAWSDYNALQEAMKKADEEWQELSNKEWFRKGVQIAEEKHFFHWELEFPEVFFGARQKNAGFDVVIGNPPYVRQEQNIFKDYFETIFETYSGRADLYVYFLELEAKLIQAGRYVGVIVSNKFTEVDYGRQLRDFLLQVAPPRVVINFADLPVFDDVTAYPMILILEKAVVEFVRFGQPPSLNDFPTNLQLTFIPITEFQWKPADKLIEKIQFRTIPLSTYSANPLVGIKTGANDAYMCATTQVRSSEEFLKPYLFGKNVGRYEITGSLVHVIFPYKRKNNAYVPVELSDLGKLGDILKIQADVLQARAIICDKFPKGLCKWYEYQQINHGILYHEPKIVFPNISNRPSFTIDEGYLTDMTVFVIPSRNTYLLALLNSKLLFYVMSSLAVKRRGGYLEWKVQYVEKLPIRCIEFTTPKPERKRLFETGKQLYESYLEKGDPSSVLEFILERLSHKPEQADVIHDLLAYLAERMIEMNKERNQEIKGFLEWLEGYLGVKVDDLKNKTRIREYHDGSLEELFKILEQNRKVITKIDVKGREVREQIKAEFEKSVATLKPLKEKIEATDKLIDQIVYKLYGLTDEEIKIVEESLSQSTKPGSEESAEGEADE